MIPAQIKFVWPQTLIEILIILAIIIVARWTLRKAVKALVHTAEANPAKTFKRLGAKATKTMKGSKDPTEMFMSVDPKEDERRHARMKTLASILNSVITVSVVIIGSFWLLRAVNIDITPVLASAGLGGLAIGFGAQSLIKDVISGTFLILEDQLGVGDIITIGDVTGTVIAMQLRVTQVQDMNGEMWYIRNGEITTLGNISQGWSNSVISIPVNIDEDPFKIINLLKQAVKELEGDQEIEKVLLDEPAVLGLSNFDSYIANYGILVKCRGNQQWGVERAIRAASLKVFQENGVDTPATPVRTVDEKSN